MIMQVDPACPLIPRTTVLETKEIRIREVLYIAIFLCVPP